VTVACKPHTQFTCILTSLTLCLIMVR